jgi:hypothetical protein
MGIFSNLFGNKQAAKSEEPEHAVIVRFQYGSTDLQRLFDLEERLEQAISAAGVGEFDGNDIAQDGSDGCLYMYGPDADTLFNAIGPVLQATDFMRGASVTLRYGPPEEGVPEIEKTIRS